jgi:PAS domain S-box-containing protein
MNTLITSDPDDRDYRQLYRLLVEDLKDFAIFAMDPDGRATSWNAGVERILGYSEPEFIGLPISALFTPEDVANGEPERERELSALHGHRPDVRWHIRKDGQPIFIDGVVTALKDDAGNLLGFSKVMRDATRRKSGQEERKRLLRQQQATLTRLRAVIDQMPAGLAIAEAPGGKLLLHNEAAVKLFGPRLTYVQDGAQHPDGTQYRPEEYPIVRAALHGEEIQREEMLYPQDDGKVTSVAVNAAPIRDEHGSIVAAVSTFHDITEQTRLMHELAERAAEMDAVFASMPDAVYVGNESGITRANQVALTMLGFKSIDELQQQISTLAERIAVRSATTGEIVPPEELAFNRALAGQSCVTEVVARNLESGQDVILRSAAAPIRQNGKVVGAVAINTDITEQKRAEKSVACHAEALARSNEALRQFAYFTSHDLKEPLRTVTSFAQLLAKRYEGKLDADADEFLHFIISGANRMDTLLTALLTYSRLVNLEPVPFAEVEIQSTLDWAIMNLQTLIEENKATITHDELPSVMGDRVQLVQLWQNLLGNAIQFRSEEPPQIHISAQHSERVWLFGVRDNGIGIDPRHAERIFGVFKRLHGGDIPGAGIGLAICQRIVEKHGGRIWVESKPGEGSTFYFTIAG